jgi:hypothetical protein
MVVAAYFHVTGCPAQANRIADRKTPTYDERDNRPTTRNFFEEVTQAAAVVGRSAHFAHPKENIGGRKP